MMDDTDKLWQQHFELCDKRDNMKKQKAGHGNGKPKRLVPSRLHELFVQIETLARYATEIVKRYDAAMDMLDDATYIVDYGNIGSKRNRQTFPHDFLGAKQYFDYIKPNYDWAEILMSVNINYSDKFIDHKRKIMKLRQMEEQNEKLNRDCRKLGKINLTI